MCQMTLVGRTTDVLSRHLKILNKENKHCPHSLRALDSSRRITFVLSVTRARRGWRFTADIAADSFVVNFAKFIMFVLPSAISVGKVPPLCYLPMSRTMVINDLRPRGDVVGHPREKPLREDR